MSNRTAAKPDDDQERIALQNRARRLQLELEGCQVDLARLRSDLELARLSQRELVGEMLTNQQEGLFQQVAAPVSQLLTQAYLIERAGKNLQARDVLAVARRIVAALQTAGLSVEGQPGQTVGFDPDAHSPLSAAVSPEAGQKVVIRFAGIRYQGKILQRAGVELVEDAG